jgi:hypothetical protein
VEQALARRAVYPAAGFKPWAKTLYQPAIESLQAVIRVKAEGDSPAPHTLEPDELGYTTREMTWTKKSNLHGTREIPAVAFR